MAFELKFGVITVCVGNVGDRFLTSGYKKRVGLEDRLKKIAGIEGITGVELCYDPDGRRGTPRSCESCSLPIGSKRPS